MGSACHKRKDPNESVAQDSAEGLCDTSPHDVEVHIDGENPNPAEQEDSAEDAALRQRIEAMRDKVDFGDTVSITAFCTLCIMPKFCELILIHSRC